MIRSFISGFVTPFQAYRIIFKNKKVLLLTILPLLVTLTLYILGMSFLFQGLESLVHWAAARLGLESTGTFAEVLIIAVKIFAVLAAGLTFSFIANLIAIPFNDFLAEQVEQTTQPPLALDFAQAQSPTVRQRFNLLTLDFGKTLFSAAILLILFFVSALPVVNLVAFLTACYLMAFQFLSYPQTRRGIGLGGGIVFMARHPFSTLGFGLCCTLLMAIPFLAVFVMPAAVTGGTLLFAKTREPGMR